MPRDCSAPISPQLPLSPPSNEPFLPSLLPSYASSHEGGGRDGTDEDRQTGSVAADHRAAPKAQLANNVHARARSEYSELKRNVKHMQSEGRTDGGRDGRVMKSESRLKISRSRTDTSLDISEARPAFGSSELSHARFCPDAVVRYMSRDRSTVAQIERTPPCLLRRRALPRRHSFVWCVSRARDGLLFCSRGIILIRYHSLLFSSLDLLIRLSFASHLISGGNSVVTARKATRVTGSWREWICYTVPCWIVSSRLRELALWSRGARTLDHATYITLARDCTVCGHRMAHRKWKELKQQPSLLPGPAVPGCCLVSFHILWAILCPQAVLVLGWWPRHCFISPREQLKERFAQARNLEPNHSSESTGAATATTAHLAASNEVGTVSNRNGREARR